MTHDLLTAFRSSPESSESKTVRPSAGYGGRSAKIKNLIGLIDDGARLTEIITLLVALSDEHKLSSYEIERMIEKRRTHVWVTNLIRIHRVLPEPIYALLEQGLSQHVALKLAKHLDNRPELKRELVREVSHLHASAASTYVRSVVTRLEWEAEDLRDARASRSTECASTATRVMPSPELQEKVAVVRHHLTELHEAMRELFFAIPVDGVHRNDAAVLNDLAGRISDMARPLGDVRKRAITSARRASK